MKNNNKYVCIGQITAAHGIKGHVRLRSYTSPPKQIFDYKNIVNENMEPLYIKRFGNNKNDDIYICSVQNANQQIIVERNIAESMAGTDLYILRQDLADIAADELYISDIEGCAVYDSDNDAMVGVVNAIVNYGAGDIIELKTSNNELILIPFNKKYFPIIDILNKKIFVNFPQYS